MSIQLPSLDITGGGVGSAYTIPFGASVQPQTPLQAAQNAPPTLVLDNQTGATFSCLMRESARQFELPPGKYTRPIPLSPADANVDLSITEFIPSTRSNLVKATLFAGYEQQIVTDGAGLPGQERVVHVPIAPLTLVGPLTIGVTGTIQILTTPLVVGQNILTNGFIECYIYALELYLITNNTTNFVEYKIEAYATDSVGTRSAPGVEVFHGHLGSSINNAAVVAYPLVNQWHSPYPMHQRLSGITPTVRGYTTFFLNVISNGYGAGIATMLINMVYGFDETNATPPPAIGDTSPFNFNISPGTPSDPQIY
jgi:hypothetical protein